jgi:hypothetical protein
VASADTVSDLIQLWNARHPAKRARLRTILAECAPASTLTGAAAHLSARTWHNLADELLRTALEQPQRFEAAQVAALLAGISKGGTATGRARRGDVAKNVIRKLDDLFSTEPDAPIGVAYLAELTCASAEVMPEPRAGLIRALIGSSMFNRGDRRLPKRYYDTLRAQGRNDLAEEFRRAELGTLKWEQTD